MVEDEMFQPPGYGDGGGNGNKERKVDKRGNDTGYEHRLYLPLVLGARFMLDNEQQPRLQAGPQASSIPDSKRQSSSPKVNVCFHKHITKNNLTRVGMPRGIMPESVGGWTIDWERRRSTTWLMAGIYIGYKVYSGGKKMEKPDGTKKEGRTKG